MPTRRRPSSEARSSILDAARRTFVSEGYAAATLADIAAQVGLTRSAVLYHFSSKDEVLRAAIEPVLAALDAEAHASVGEDGRPTAEVQQQRVERLLDRLQEHRAATHLAVHFTTAATTAGIGERLSDLNLQLVRHLAGPAAASDTVAITRAMAALLVLTGGVTTSTLADQNQEAVRAALVDCAMDLLRPRGSGREAA